MYFSYAFKFYTLSRSQDFEALTPNLLARTVETVEGGGIVVILLRSMNSLKQLYTMSMVSPPHLLLLCTWYLISSPAEPWVNANCGCRMSILDTGLRPIRTWLEDSMRGAIIWQGSMYIIYSW